MNTRIGTKKKDFLKNIKTYVRFAQQGVNIVVNCQGTSFMLSPIIEDAPDDILRMAEQAIEDRKNGKTIPLSEVFPKNISNATEE
jgi:hypothetical protein